ncbi:MAG TPA: amidohydrolase family protein [Steroidobacter sp.]|jgi:5-methylthioadenosine/S-adenosylhomocysteine deaminase|nr:amidohydrolase family protein [Steroidobacter sp.]
MEHIDTLITARWIVPIEPENQVLEDHAIAIRQGRIVALLPRAEASRRFVSAQTCSRPNHVVLPGFVNAHTQAAASLLRGAVQHAGADPRLKTPLAAIEPRWMDADYVRDGTALAIADMLTSGVTCFADAHLFPEAIAQTASAARIRACVGLPICEAQSLWAGDIDECFEKGLRLHDDYREDPLISTAFAPDAPCALSDAALARLRRNADELELPITLPLNETPEGGSAGERTLERLERLGLTSPLLAAVHMVHFEDSDADRLARAGSNVVHCPRANLRLGAGVCRTGALAARGVNIALGTGGASGHGIDMLEELRAAALIARGVHTRDPDMTAHAWLKAATLNGARALGLSEITGSLTPQKWADLCCIDLHRPQTQPLYDVPGQIVFGASRDQISDVWVAGRALVRAGQLTHMDLEDVLRRAALWRERIIGSFNA